jgi:hypothetical protein
MKKGTIVALILVFVIFFGAFVYFVTGVSATGAPIKKYQFFGTINQLLTGLQKYASNNPDMTFKITDTTGNQTNGYAIYMEIKMLRDEHHIQYTLKCEKNTDNSNDVETKVELVFAYDATFISGGYQKNARGVKVLVDYFDTDFLVGLENNQHIKLITLKPTFFDPLKHFWNGD